MSNISRLLRNHFHIFILIKFTCLIYYMTIYQQILLAVIAFEQIRLFWVSFDFYVRAGCLFLLRSDEQKQQRRVSLQVGSHISTKSIWIKIGLQCSQRISLQFDEHLESKANNSELTEPANISSIKFHISTTERQFLIDYISCPSAPTANK